MADADAADFAAADFDAADFEAAIAVRSRLGLKSLGRTVSTSSHLMISWRQPMSMRWFCKD